MTKRSSQTLKQSRRGRAILFRCAAVMLGLAFLVLLEVLFRALGWGQPDVREDPFLGFHGVRPLFVLNEDGSRFEIPLSRQGFFRPQSFSANKKAEGFRVFCLGGSTVQGRPFSTETSFTTWLQIGLQTAEAQRDWEVVNCGGVSYASYRLVPILQEVLQYEPDLIIIYTGHNEFLEDRTYAHIRDRSRALVALQSVVARLHTYQLLRGQYLRFRGGEAKREIRGRPQLGVEVDAILDYRGGLLQYQRDEAWRRDVIGHYQSNLDRMIRLAKQAQVPLLLVNPVSDLRDTPPFKSEHGAGLSSDQLRRWTQLQEAARSFYGTDLHRSIQLFEKALAIDDQHAGLHYQLGQCYDTLGNIDLARQHYLQAKDLDICPLRMLEPMHESLSETAGSHGTPVIDARALISGLCRGGIPDQSWMADHVHPTIAGHQKIADAIAEWFVQQSMVHPPPDWASRQSAAYQAQWDSLEPIYFETGRQRREILRDWAHGRMTREHDSQ